MDSKCYGLLQVMGYHSMGYLRFDCNGDYKPNVTVQRFFNRGLVKTMISGDCRENVTVREVTVGECDCIQSTPVYSSTILAQCKF